MITLLCGADEVIKEIDLKTRVDDGETIKNELVLTGMEQKIVTYCEGGHVQTEIDLNKLLSEVSIIAPDLYMKFVTSKMMRDHT